jgi:hypothetical protein
MTETGVVKTCVQCGKNLNGQKRMKDSQGRYWCLECGEADQKKKAASAAAVGANICSGCGDTFPAHQLQAWGSKRLCPKCSPSSKGPGVMATVTGLFKGGGGSGGGSDKKKIAIMFIVMVILASIALYINFG